MTVDEAYSYLFLGSLIIIAICILFVIIKSIIGPRISDRIVTANMIGTLVTACIAILSTLLINQTYLIDICIIYVLLSFISVIVLSSIFINQYIEKKNSKKDGE